MSDDIQLNDGLDDDITSLPMTPPPDPCGSFRTSAEVDLISEAFAKAYAEMNAAEKTATNPHFRSGYADMASVDGEIRPKLAKQSLFIIQTLARRPFGPVCVTRVMHKSGQWIESEVLYNDPGPNAGAQKHGSALTYARRYGLMTAVGLAVSDKTDDDGNAASEPSGQPHSMTEPRRTYGGPKRMNSKFPGKCALCGRLIDEGEEIAYNGKTKKSSHWHCWEAYQRGENEPEPQVVADDDLL